MTVNVVLLIVALAVLWLPRQWLRLGIVLVKRRTRRNRDKELAAAEPWNVREPGDPRVYFRTEFGKFRNYVDLLRGLAGGVCVAGGFYVEPCLQAAANAPGAQVRGVLALKGLILLVGLLAQTIRYERGRLTFYPPIFYLAGMSVPLCEPSGAAFAFVAIWAINPAFGSVQGFLSIYAVLMVVFGQYFGGIGDKTSICAGILCFLPVLLSLLANLPLIVFARKAQHAAAPS